MKKLFLTMGLWVSLTSHASGFQKLDIDAGHSTVQFSVSNMAVNTVRGKFQRWSGYVQYQPNDIAQSNVKVILAASSIDTGNKKRDNHLVTADFFDAARFPELTFESKSIVKEEDRYIMTGNLTIHGVTKSVPVSFTVLEFLNKGEGKALRASGKAVIDRRDFGIRYGNKFTIGNEVTIVFEIEAWDNPKQP